MANEYSGIALQANKHKKVQTLMHYVNERNLEQEHKLQKSGKATGADGMNKEKYDASLKENIDNLLSRMKRFSYRPQAVKRAYIPRWEATRCVHWEYQHMKISWYRELCGEY